MAFIVTLVLFFKPLIIENFVPLAISIIMFVTLMLKLGYLKQVRKDQKKDFGVCLLIFILMIVLSILIVLNPMEDVLNINQSMGMIIIFYSILDIIMSYLFKNNID